MAKIGFIFISKKGAGYIARTDDEGKVIHSPNNPIKGKLNNQFITGKESVVQPKPDYDRIGSEANSFFKDEHGTLLVDKIYKRYYPHLVVKIVLRDDLEKLVDQQATSVGEMTLDYFIIIKKHEQDVNCATEQEEKSFAKNAGQNSIVAEPTKGGWIPSETIKKYDKELEELDNSNKQKDKTIMEEKDKKTELISINEALNLEIKNLKEKEHQYETITKTNLELIEQNDRKDKIISGTKSANQEWINTNEHEDEKIKKFKYENASKEETIQNLKENNSKKEETVQNQKEENARKDEIISEKNSINQDLMNANQDKDEKIEKLKYKNADKEKMIQNLKKNNSEKEETIQNLNMEIKTLQEQQHQHETITTKNIARKDKQIKQLKIENADKEETVQNLKEDNSEKEEIISERNSTNQELKEENVRKDKIIKKFKYENVGNEETIQNLKKNNSEKEESIQNLKEKNSEKDITIQNEKEENARKVEIISERNSTNQELINENEHKDETIRNMADDIDCKNKEIQRVEEENEAKRLKENEIKDIICRITSPPPQVSFIHKEIIKSLKKKILSFGLQLVEGDAGPSIVLAVNNSRIGADVKRDLAKAELNNGPILLLIIKPTRKLDEGPYVNIIDIEDSRIQEVCVFLVDPNISKLHLCKKNNESFDTMIKFLKNC